MSKKQMGFTLIEIVMVLVLLGILSAVAVPKYFDLKDQAETKAVGAIAAEVQARLNGGFADALLNGTSIKDGEATKVVYDCSNARKAGIEEAKKAITESGSISTNYTTNIATFSKDATSNFDLTITGDKPHTFSIAVPQCK